MPKKLVLSFRDSMWDKYISVSFQNCQFPFDLFNQTELSIFHNQEEIVSTIVFLSIWNETKIQFSKCSLNIKKSFFFFRKNVHQNLREVWSSFSPRDIYIYIHIYIYIYIDTHHYIYVIYHCIYCIYVICH